MRPLVIAHTESSEGWGGQEIRILTEAAGMQSRGHRVVVHGAHGSRILAEAPRFGVPAVALPIGRKRPAGVVAVRRALHAAPFDIVNTHSSTDTWLTAVALRIGNRARPVLVRTRHVSVPVPNDAATRPGRGDRYPVKIVTISSPAVIVQRAQTVRWFGLRRGRTTSETSRAAARRVVLSAVCR